MRQSMFPLLLVLALTSPVALAVDVKAPPPPDIKGLWLTTDFPAATVRAGEEARFSVAVIMRALRQQEIARLAATLNASSPRRASRTSKAAARSRSHAAPSGSEGAA